MASRKYGALVPEHRPPDPDITRDVPDTTEIQEVSAIVHRECTRPRAIAIALTIVMDDYREVVGTYERISRYY